jgi:hypothetical protein
MEMKGNKEQTAVEWLYIKMYENNGRITKEEYEEAKEMGKQQIIKAHDDQYNYDMWPSSIPTLGQQYYNERFGQ